MNMSWASWPPHTKNNTPSGHTGEPVHRCQHALCVVLVNRSQCTVSWASWLLFTGVHTQSALCVVLRVR